MLELTDYEDSPLCHGFTWAITDEPKLAEVVAWLILGEHLHARDILRQMSREDPAAHRQHIDRWIAEFSATPANDNARWQRDGWMFQMLSWVAAQLGGPSHAIIKAPQARRSDKGLDAFIVVPRRAGALSALVIGEDKATENPRATITSKVWPEFREFNSHVRDNEIMTELGSLLERLSDDDERRAVINEAMWQQPWRYRVSITADLEHEGRDGRAVLFAGYDNTIDGTGCERRRGETIVLADMRAWMDAFAQRIAEALTRLREVAGV
jgi:hypothetical protein